MYDKQQIISEKREKKLVCISAELNLSNIEQFNSLVRLIYGDCSWGPTRKQFRSLKLVSQLVANFLLLSQQENRDLVQSEYASLKGTRCCFGS